jgi:hypothetical protein
MHERVGTWRPSRVRTFWISIAVCLTGACADTAEQDDPQLSAPGDAAPTGASAGAAAPMSGSAGMRATAGAPMPGVGQVTAGRSSMAAAGAPAQTSTASAGAGGAASVPPTAISAGAGGGAAPASSGAAGGAAGAAAGSAGASGGAMVPPGSNNFVSVCEGGKVGMDSDAAKATLRDLDIRREYSGVKMLIRSPNAVLSFKTTLQVPKPPTQRQTLFVWPGLQSRDGAADPNRVGNGVLQPVLTWGPSCNPKLPADPYAGWWIAGMYVKTGCQGGDYLTTELGDLLEIDMFLKDEKWETTIRNVMMDKTVDFTMDLRGQVQNEVMWLTEVPDGSSIRPVDDVIWTQNVLTFKEPEETCQPNRIGSNDYFSAPILSPDGLHCCWDKIIMRAER